MNSSLPARPTLQAAGRGTDRRTVALCELRPGERARVHDTGLRCDECELLRAMGLTEACELRVCRGGPRCIVEINSTRLGLSPAMSRTILVSAEPPAPAPAPGA